MRNHRRATGALVTLLAVGIAGGCTDAPPAERLSWRAAEMTSPAGQDSGQPFLSEVGDTVMLSWLERSGPGTRRLLFSRYVEGSWGAPEVVAERGDFLVNVADVPSVVGGPGGLWAHWLQRDETGGFGYGIRVVHSADGGTTWTEPWRPHEDASPTDHGFVSFVPTDREMAILWLDGRAFAPAAAEEPTMETALYVRRSIGGAPVGPELRLDPRVCDCCPTDVALTDDGPILVYRDRSPGEIRDIRVLMQRGGEWVEGPLVHEDGWETGVCPINGPAVAARGSRAAVAWFTAAEGESRVQVALSNDSGRSFAEPVRVDDGAPAGRVDTLLLEDGSALVAWVERTGGAGSEVRMRRVSSSGRRLETIDVTASATERVMGFPHLARAGDGAIIVAWTDGAELTPRVRVTRIEVEES